MEWPYLVSVEKVITQRGNVRVPICCAIQASLLPDAVVKTCGRRLCVSTGCGGDADVSQSALGKKTSETVCVCARVKRQQRVPASAY